MGAEQDAYMTVDGRGTPFAGGGLNAGLRDLGRIGLLLLNEGEINDQRLFVQCLRSAHSLGGAIVVPVITTDQTAVVATEGLNRAPVRHRQRQSRSGH